MPILVNMPSLDPADVIKAKNDIETLKSDKADKIQISNPNLLINPDFQINQRQGKIVLAGVTAYSDSDCTTVAETTASPYTITNLTSTYGQYTYNDGTNDVARYVKAEDVVDGYCNTTKGLDNLYTVDRWATVSGYLTLSDAGITFTNKYDSYNAYIFQRIELLKSKYQDEIFTLTVKTNRDTIVKTSKLGYIVGGNGIIVGTDWSEDGTYLRVFIQNGFNTINDCFEIESVKLELGSASTQFVPPDPASELLKCQRYFQVIRNNLLKICSNENDGAFFHGVTLCEMRVNPTVTFNIEKTDPCCNMGVNNNSSGWYKNYFNKGNSTTDFQINIKNDDTTKHASALSFLAYKYPIYLNAEL